RVCRVLKNHLAPARGLLCFDPPLVEMRHVYGILHPQPFEYMKEQERRLVLIQSYLTCQEGGAGDTRVQLAQIQRPGVLVQQKIEAEISPIAYLPDVFANRHRGVLCLLADLWGKRWRLPRGKDLVA